MSHLMSNIAGRTWPRHSFTHNTQRKQPTFSVAFSFISSLRFSTWYLPWNFTLPLQGVPILFFGRILNLHLLKICDQSHIWTFELSDLFFKFVKQLVFQSNISFEFCDFWLISLTLPFYFLPQHMILSQNLRLFISLFKFVTCQTLSLSDVLFGDKGLSAILMRVTVFWSMSYALMWLLC